MEPVTGMRRSDLDWMRLVLVLAAFLLACARALGLACHSAKAPGVWLSPPFFMVSAGSAWHSLERQGAATFVVAKVLRLFVPLVACALAIAVGALRCLVLVIAPFAVVTVLYAVVRRLTLLRFLFGLSPSAARSRGAEHKGGSL